MPTSKLSIKQFTAKDGKTYMFYRYWDDHNNNYEYQVYELVTAKKVARKLGASEKNGPNTRKMCDWVWENVKVSD